jgi:hypothetical protein
MPFLTWWSILAKFEIPDNWPSWNKVCGAKRRNGKSCALKAVVGCPRCRFHGSGGQANADLGQLRYLCWVITGGPQNMPVEHACRVALAVFAEAVLKQGKGTPDQQMKAALWLTQALDDR